ncbi:reprolysin-like metallopeptidase [Nocardioides sp. GXZ039]|uniref:reprolysin-like metallopeptidase n=1 Tax=Nocardioides sp. GXZ039 TaxID=3136018 RepID=UPI0030F39FAF
MRPIRSTARPGRVRAVRWLAGAAAVVLAAALVPAGPANSAAAPAAGRDPVFRPLDGFKPTGDKIRVHPDRYSAVRVDLAGARAALAGAPAEGDGGGVDFALPTPTGATERFSVQRTAVLAPRLAAAHPEISTYFGRSLSNPGYTVALDVTPMGLHAAVRGPQGQGAWYVDPAYDRRGTTTHLSFYGSDTTRPEQAFAEQQAPEVRHATARRARGTSDRAAGTVVEKRYRLALTSDPSYAAYFGSENVLAEKATLINRVNQIYKQDLAVTLQLINRTDDLNFDTPAKATGPNGPCGAEPCFRSVIYPDDPPADQFGDLDFCSGETLARNRIVLGQVIGADNYDVGHIALGVNGGGVAYLGVVGADYKGGGCTGLPEPKGDFFAIDYVAHEIGHQFSGNHTFNGIYRACSGGNRNAETSVEPGSGSSVMAYAGICRQDNLQDHSDPYFSARTLDEVNAYTGAKLPDVVEVQTVSLSGFGAAGSTVTLGFRGASATIAASDDRAAIEAKVEALTGQDVTIAEWGYDPYGSYTEYPAPIQEPGDTGFQVIFASTSAPDAPGAHTNQPSITVTGGSAGVHGFVGETARGGKADNGGTTLLPTANHAPSVTSVDVVRKVPARTPFLLSGKARDADGDPLTYMWEQTDDARGHEGTALPSNRKIYGPLFRIFGSAALVSDEAALESPAPGQNHPTSDGTRYFPDLAQVLSGNTNARTGRCPKAPPPPPDDGPNIPLDPKLVECYSEFLPTGAYLGTPGMGKRTMHFRLTVRDGRGGIAYRNVKVVVAKGTGPLVVNSQAKKGYVAKKGSTIPVVWKVNGTKKLSKKVTIYLSTNGGRSWSRTLAKATANDGRQMVRLPKGVSTKKARIIVAAKSGGFYAVNRSDFKIR